ncbi:hypothetical protein [Flavisolibacter tropicus]|uniref:Uncharacterized protein n=1 Tax=Flavisolibacter tropicus TaxID=1492898 RepID=A0A172U117_9BACT|nr:hypothetical protein [Flavisolibacter tropicus]ANE53049.1 hypothetical protein SY85_23810 [Flavisolibacter tropicus]
MEGLEQQRVLFHDRARNVFFSIYSEFRHSIASVDRQGDENVFQQLQNRYVSQLHSRLNSIALELLEQAEGTNRNQLSVSLSQSIKEYINEFMQKVKSL